MIFDVIGTMTSTKITIGTLSTSELALAANADRVYALFNNDSNKPMYLRFGTDDAVEHEGVMIAATGGSYEITKDNLYLGAVQVICEAADKALLVTEGTLT